MKLALVSAAAASVLALAAIPAAASAAPGDWGGPQWTGYYGTLGYTGTDVTGGGPDLGALTGRFGWKSNMYLGVEGEASVGVQHDTLGGALYNLNDQYAGYVTATLPVAHNFEIFGRIGYGQTRINTNPKTVGDVRLEGTDNSFNYGAGAQYFWDGKNGIRGDYTREDFQQGGGDANVWSASFVHRF
jgi:outer membrane immunogenic protein